MLQKLSMKIQRVTSIKSFLILLFIYLLVYSIFFHANVPFGLNRMKQYAGSVNILDVNFFYTAPQAYEILDQLGKDGQSIYMGILAADMVYPLALGILLSVTTTLILQNILSSTSKLYLLGALPLINTFFDYCENAATFMLLINYPSRLNAIATIDGFLTLGKNIFGFLSIIVVVISLIVLIYQKSTTRTILHNT